MGDSNYFSQAASPKYRPRFIRSIVDFVDVLGWDGVDIDWEYPGFEHGGQPLPGDEQKGSPDDVTDCSRATCQSSYRLNDGENYVALLTELRQALDQRASERKRSEPYLITIAGPAGSA